MVVNSTINMSGAGVGTASQIVSTATGDATSNITINRTYADSQKLAAAVDIGTYSGLGLRIANYANNLYSGALITNYSVGNWGLELQIGGSGTKSLYAAGTVQFAIFTSDGFVKTDASGTLSVDTTTYLTSSGSITGNAATATKLETARTITATGDGVWSVSFDGSANVSSALTLTTVNTNVGSFGSATAVPVVTVNGKGLVTGVSVATITASGLGALTMVTGDTTSRTANTVYAAPNGSAGTATFRALVAADIPALAYAPTAGSSSIVTLGTVTTGTWHATAIGAAYGGTGQTVYVVGDILYASTTTALSRLADVATGKVLISGGVGVAPSWGQAVLTSAVTGVLPVANGGTALSTLTGAYYLPYSTSATVMAVLAPNTTTSIKGLTMTGTGSAGADPAWTAVVTAITGDGIVVPTTTATTGVVAFTHAAFGTAGTYGSASTVSVLTTNATGHVTGVTATTIAITHSQVSDWSTTLAGYLPLSAGSSNKLTGTLYFASYGIIAFNSTGGPAIGLVPSDTGFFTDCITDDIAIRSSGASIRLGIGSGSSASTMQISSSAVTLSQALTGTSATFSGDLVGNGLLAVHGTLTPSTSLTAGAYAGVAGDGSVRLAMSSGSSSYWQINATTSILLIGRVTDAEAINPLVLDVSNLVVRPGANNTYTLGTNAQRWSTVYSYTENLSIGVTRGVTSYASALTLNAAQTDIVYISSGNQTITLGTDATGRSFVVGNGSSNGFFVTVPSGVTLNYNGNTYTNQTISGVFNNYRSYIFTEISTTVWVAQ
jgi:hypothetical protein